MRPTADGEGKTLRRLVRKLSGDAPRSFIHVWYQRREMSPDIGLKIAYFSVARRTWTSPTV